MIQHWHNPSLYFLVHAMQDTTQDDGKEKGQEEYIYFGIYRHKSSDRI